MRGALDSWVVNPRPPSVIPRLAVARDSVAVLLWGRWRPEALLASPEERGDLRHDALMQSIARKHRMIRIEAFASMSPQNRGVQEFRKTPYFENSVAFSSRDHLTKIGRRRALARSVLSSRPCLR
jgi:hypothetical protein